MEAVGLASSIITFIDVAYKIVRGSYNVYKTANGEIEEDDHTSFIVGDLKKVAADLKYHPQTMHDKDLVELSARCCEISGELLHVMEKFLPKGPSKRQSFVAACRILRKQKEVASIETRLDRYRQQIAERLLWLLFKQQSPMKQALDEMLHAAHTFHNSSAEKMENLGSQLAQTLELLQKKEDGKKTVVQTTDEVHNMTSQANNNLHTVSTNTTETVAVKILSDVATQVHNLSSLVKSMPIQNRILRRLFFRSIFRREDEVIDAVGDTFRWIYEAREWKYITSVKAKDVHGTHEDSEDMRRLRTSSLFLEFLRHDKRTFFIAGKAGSGKSTFMKYIAHHRTTESSLRAWASTKKLVVVKVFFWQSDDARQGSMEGFFRSILFQVLSQCPEFVGDIFPSQQTGEMVDAAEYRLSELESAFERLLRFRHADKYCFCCFIDGLDEHKGDNMSYENLARQLISWSSRDNVKIICSARPYTVFLDAFKVTGSVVDFHRLTYSDISNFAVAKFENSLSSQRMLGARINCLAMVEAITENAEGIFLWASIVVRDLTNQALDYDGSEKALRRRLQECLECGDSLDNLFQLMLQRVDKGPYAQMRSNMALYLAANNPFESPLNALVFSWLNELEWFQGLNDAPCPLDSLQEAYSERDISSKVEAVRRLLHQLTRGLLEVADTHDRVPYFRYRVDLCHRSVREFLKEQWKSGARQTPFLTPTEEVQAYCRLRSLEASCITRRQSTAPISSNPDFDSSLKMNLRSLFEYTFIWLGSSHRKGGTPPYKCLSDFQEALDQSQEMLGPFLLGLLLIGDDLSWRYHTRDAIYTTSFLHWAAYWSQGEFVRRQLSNPVSELNDTSSFGLNLLLASSVATDVEATTRLLSQGFRPDAQVQIMDAQSDLLNRTTTVWMILLRDFAINVRSYCRQRKYSHTWPRHLDRDWLERLSKILEAYLEAHAYPHVYFILAMENLRGTYRADLTRMLDVFKPGNLASFATLLRRPWWKDLLSVGVLQSPTPATHQYINSDLLLNGDWRVLGVCSECGEELMGPFKVRVF